MSEQELLKKIQKIEEKVIEQDYHKDLEKLYLELLQIKNFRYKVTDHSILRYLQRIELISVSKARYMILSSVEKFVQKKLYKKEYLKNIRWKLGIENVVYIIENRTIITVEKK